jgi:hypothetical protein
MCTFVRDKRAKKFSETRRREEGNLGEGVVRVHVMWDGSAGVFQELGWCKNSMMHQATQYACPEAQALQKMTV